MVEHHGGRGDGEGVAQLANKKMARRNVVLVGKRRPGLWKGWRLATRMARATPLQRGRHREKPVGGGRRPEVNEVDVDSAPHQHQRTQDDKSTPA